MGIRNEWDRKKSEASKKAEKFKAMLRNGETNDELQELLSEMRHVMAVSSKLGNAALASIATMDSIDDDNRDRVVLCMIGTMFTTITAACDEEDFKRRLDILSEMLSDMRKTFKPHMNTAFKDSDEFKTAKDVADALENFEPDDWE
ncbi:MAG TPA: hypothetical protein VNA25_04985 [Phycisphaerae bacterium]|nr:hypothetical protein [Phycisphaerae bacterium]